MLGLVKVKSFCRACSPRTILQKLRITGIAATKLLHGVKSSTHSANLSGCSGHYNVQDWILEKRQDHVKDNYTLHLYWTLSHIFAKVMVEPNHLLDGVDLCKTHIGHPIPRYPGPIGLLHGA